MTNFPDMVTQFGGSPISSGRYDGMWGSKVWFVDYDNGSAGSQGKKPTDAQKYLDTILDKAGEWDVIYLRPRDPDTSGGDPQSILPLSTTANFDVASTQHGLSLIGTGIGNNAAYSARIQGASGVTEAAITVNAPYVNIENLGIRKGSSTAGSLYVTAAAFASSVNNCHFRLGGTKASSVGAVIIDSAWYNKITNSVFSACPIGIVLAATTSAPQEIVITGCEFNGGASAIDADIFSTGTVTRILIRDCYFDHAVPAVSAGDKVRYIKFSAASTGLVANCFTGAVDPTVADNMTLDGVLYSNIWGDGVGPFVDA